MSNNYSKFSETILALNLEEQAWLREELKSMEDRPDWPDDEDEKEQAQYAKAFEEERGIQEGTGEYWPNFNWQIEKNDDTHVDWWLYSEESFDVDAVVAAVQRFLQRFRPEDIFAMSWSETCSKPRTGEFGGGWIAVSANDCESGNTWEASGKAVDRLQEEIKCLKRKKKKKLSNSA